MVAVDVGGTTVKAAILGGGQAPQVLSRPTPYGAETVVAAVADIVDELTTNGEASGVGIVVPGIVDELRGIGVHSANLGWRDAPLRTMLRDRIDLPVQLGHDVRAGAMAEFSSLPSPVESMAFMAIGTGIAMGAVLGGKPWAADGFAGEIGHADIGHAEPCSCGKRGCFEAVGSARAIAARYTSISGREAEGAITVAQRLDEDPVAQRVWSEAVAAAAQAIEWVASTIAPETVVIGGGLAQAGETLLAPLRDAVGERLTVQRSPRLIRAQYGAHSGLYGAALLALKEAGGTPVETS